ncbi:hypothetical protein NGB36_30615 [Streptomyces sp. RB6PN25]|uniref:Uncharacterized protein n=1 Tax=Streptomyces humicola TaxID=2953240 RepID=A0ABT1Q4E8_9ACTN|nr:hypothetical protein [Streptomyces humicola]MCQ4084807.1 hypothetical protein [Streptomyces humicola]
MTERRFHAVVAEARRTVPGREWRPDEEHRYETLVRPIGAVATVSAVRTVEQLTPRC